MSDFDPQLLKGLLALLVLALLAERDDYGYALVERLRSGGLGNIAEGTVYPALARLERGGLVDSYHVPSGRGPARKYYRLSEEGRRQLDSRHDAWRRLAVVVDNLTNNLGTKGASS